MFIAFEGIDGSGKTTVIREINRILADFLGDGKIVVTREPGGTPFAEKLRTLLLEDQEEVIDPITQVLLFSAARRQHLSQRIVPALKARKVVITDRFADSTIAYQAAQSNNPSEIRERIERITAETVGEWYPNLVIWLDVPPDVSIIRRADRGSTDAMEERIKDRLVKMRELYSIQMERHQQYQPFGPVEWVRIDATLPLDEVVAAVQQAIFNSHGWKQYTHQY